MKKAMIILNPSSGKEQANKNTTKIVSTLERVGYEVDVRITEQEGDAKRFAECSCDEKFDAVISVGGDGTLNEVVNGLAEKPHLPTLGVLPLGTLNDFARALNIPLESDQAIAVLEKQRIKEVDICKIGNQYFTNIMAAGALPQATSNVSIEQKTRLGSLAYVLEGLKTLVNKETFHLQMKHDHGEWEGEAILVLASLTNTAGGFEKFAPDAEVNDGHMRSMIIKDVSIAKLPGLALSLLKGEHIHDPSIEYVHAKRLYLSADQALTTNIDGERGPSLPVELSVLPKHLNVFVP
ncbi:diacylglycerol/lipid kinase family protein [Metabacillus iocasae]|uniref:YegS/Rv2252/BmrU family lipid kinase n=1 Tax=Priestia iocasae TaxID=2291674 RepID=A0ABS2QZ13_9BACI|nr:diacylglycerol kinase family protein [Metabacillus iocasae]MBM7703699.1 YegS/Rv2252/BmrU family lipid kinase [Metabacillus iocasae]